MITLEHLKHLIKGTNNMFLAHIISRGDDLLAKCQQRPDAPLNVIIVPTHFNTRFMATYKNHNFGLLLINQALFIITNSDNTYEDVIQNLIDKVSLDIILDIMKTPTPLTELGKKQEAHFANMIWDFYNYNIYHRI